MLGNGIKQTTATTGTGALTLSAVTGMPTLADVFAVNQPISYALLDASGLYIEAGVGYLSSSTVFVRSKVHASYVAGVYTKIGAAAVNLSGTTTIIVTPHAASMGTTAPTMDTVSSIGRYLTSAARSAVTVTAAITINRVVYSPFYLNVPISLVSLAVNVTVLQAASIIKTGVYAMGPNGYIGDQIAAAPDIDSSTTGFKVATLATPVVLMPGWYFTAAVPSGSATGPTTSNYQGALANVHGGGALGLVSGGITVIECRYEAISAGAALPTTPSATTTQAGVGTVNIAAVYMGAA